MPLEIPPIDGRTYRELLDDMLARVPVHTPEWTNRNAADPGVTLLQLFAYMGESILYRSGLIPERNRLAFLRLLGYDRLPATAASGIVTFRSTRADPVPVVLQPDLPLHAGNVAFRTDNGLAVLPIDGVAFVKRGTELNPQERDAVDAGYDGLVDTELARDYYHTTVVDWADETTMPLDLADTVDGIVWLALLARTADDVAVARAALAGQSLSLGVVPDPAVTRRTLPAGGQDPRAALASLEYHLPDLTTALPSGGPLEGRASYVPVPATAPVDVLADAGVVTLELPGAAGLQMWELEPAEDGVGALPPALDGDDAERLVTWLRIRPIAAGDGVDADSALASVRLRWLGVNAATARQRARVTAEVVGRGTGEADQTMTLANTPVLRDTLTVTVGGEAWTAVDDLATAGAEATLPAGSAPALPGDVDRASVFTVDRSTGEIAFGDGIHGRRPRAVVQASYDHGGGAAGLVAADAITRGGQLPGGVAVTNPVATWGGAEAESVAEAERSIAAFVRHRDRIVTVEDAADITRRAPGVQLGRVEVLAGFSPDLPDLTAPGALTVMVIPAADPRHPDTPEPDRYFVDAVCAHLDPRRLITTELHVSGPVYVPIWASIGIDVLGGHDLAVVREAVRNALRTFLSPLRGGHAGEGWPLSTAVERLELWAQAARVDGVAKVNGVELAEDDGVDRERVPLSGLALPRLVGLSVRRGGPLPVADVQGITPPDDSERLPIPVVPLEC